jgi:hypothetical protein
MSGNADWQVRDILSLKRIKMALKIKCPFYLKASVIASDLWDI